MMASGTQLSNEFLREGARDVVQTLVGAGYEAYWAGGCVRDMILGLVPADYDVATSARPDEVIGLFPRTVEVGKAFGVVCVLTEGRSYDVATFRAEGAYSDGRRPDNVSWADAQADVIRRDFTINGLLYDPLEDRVLDFVDGQEDLRAGIIRAIGEPIRRFEEDYLRILRAIRFSARFHFEIESLTLEAMARAAQGVGRMSAERIEHELSRILTEGSAKEGLVHLRDLAIWPLVLAEVGDADLAIERFAGLDPLPNSVAWANLCAGQAMTADDIAGMADRLRFSTKLKKEIVGTILCAEGLASYPKLGSAERKKLVRQSWVSGALTILSVGGAHDKAHGAAQRDLERWSTEDLHPLPLLRGDDLENAGITPGPVFGRILAELENEQLEGRIDRVEQAWTMVERLLEAEPG